MTPSDGIKQLKTCMLRILDHAFKNGTPGEVKIESHPVKSNKLQFEIKGEERYLIFISRKEIMNYNLNTEGIYKLRFIISEIITALVLEVQNKDVSDFRIQYQRNGSGLFQVEIIGAENNKYFIS